METQVTSLFSHLDFFVNKLFWNLLFSRAKQAEEVHISSTLRSVGGEMELDADNFGT